MSAQRRNRRDEVGTRRDLVPNEPPAGLVVSKSSDLAVFAFPIPTPELPTNLSDAEREVVQLALAGMSNQQIARCRGCASRTIANQLASAFRKVGVHSRAELAARFCRR